MGFHLLVVDVVWYLVRFEHMHVENLTVNLSRPGMSAL